MGDDEVGLEKWFEFFLDDWEFWLVFNIFWCNVVNGDVEGVEVVVFWLDELIECVGNLFIFDDNYVNGIWI